MKPPPQSHTASVLFALAICVPALIVALEPAQPTRFHATQKPPITSPHDSQRLSAVSTGRPPIQNRPQSSANNNNNHHHLNGKAPLRLRLRGPLRVKPRANVTSAMKNTRAEKPQPPAAHLQQPEHQQQQPQPQQVEEEEEEQQEQQQQQQPSEPVHVGGGAAANTIIATAAAAAAAFAPPQARSEILDTRASTDEGLLTAPVTTAAPSQPLAGLVSGAQHALQVINASAEDRKLLCLFQVYTDSFVSISKVDVNDRLVLLVPLIIIYWHHRYQPAAALTYTEIDGLLRGVGQEGEVHRLALQEFVRRVNTENECGGGGGGSRVGESGHAAPFGSSTTSSQQQQQPPPPPPPPPPQTTTPSPLPASTLTPLPHYHNKQDKAMEAMRILRDWIDEEERLVEVSARESGAREMRNWFTDLIGANRHRAATSMTSDGQTGGGGGGGGGRSSGTFATLLPVRASAGVTAPSVLLRERIETTTTTTTTATEPTTTTMAPSTTEPFGMPHYETRARDYHVALASSTLPPPSVITSTSSTTTTTPPNTRAEIDSRASGGINMTTSLLNELMRLRPSSVTPPPPPPPPPPPTSAVSRWPSGETARPPTHYSEFFDMVTSIIEEINHLNDTNTSVGVTTTSPTISPSIV